MQRQMYRARSVQQTGVIRLDGFEYVWNLIRTNIHEKLLAHDILTFCWMQSFNDINRDAIFFSLSAKHGGFYLIHVLNVTLICVWIMSELVKPQGLQAKNIVPYESPTSTCTLVWMQANQSAPIENGKDVNWIARPVRSTRRKTPVRNIRNPKAFVIAGPKWCEKGVPMCRTHKFQ